MAIAFGTSRTCKYVGTIPIYLRTLTTTYAPIANGWRFTQGAPYPMAQWARRLGGANAGTVMCIQGSLFDTTNIHTDWTIGRTTDPVSSPPFIGWAIWNQNRLFGWLNQGTLTEPIDMASFNYGLIPGTSRVLNPLQSIKQLPLNIANPLTGVFTKNIDAVMYSSSFGAGRSYLLAASSSTVNFAFIKGDNSFVGITGAYTNSNASQAMVSCLLPYGNVIFSPVNLNVNNSPSVLAYGNIGLTGWQGVNVTWDNAAINTQMQLLSGGFYNSYPSNFGWVTELNTVTATIGGETITGMIILTSPDCQTYVVLKIIPVDAQAVSWKGLAGNGYAMLDPNGVLFSHQVNQDGVIYVSAGSVIQSLPIYPPIALPPPPLDPEHTLKRYRYPT